MFRLLLVKKLAIIIGAFAALAAQAGERPARILITNDARAITAYRVDGARRETLFSVHTQPAAAAISAPPYLAALINEAAKTHGVDPRLVAAVASRESAWNATAVSRTGACGIMQLMPSTARHLGVSNIFDSRENIFGGTRYLRALLDSFNGDVDLTLAAYNAGPGAVQKFGGIPPYRETQDYVRHVRAAYERALAR
jgi:soluble lytic murein transglycosylase-like protein